MKILTKTKCLRPALNSIILILELLMHFLFHMIVKKYKETTAFEDTLKKEKEVSKQKYSIACLFPESLGLLCALWYIWIFVCMGIFVGFVMILYSQDGILCNFLSFDSTAYIFQSNNTIQVGIS